MKSRASSIVDSSTTAAEGGTKLTLSLEDLACTTIQNESTQKNNTDIISLRNGKNIREKNSPFEPKQKVMSVKAVRFAIKRCQKFLACSVHDDIDRPTVAEEIIPESTWEQFIKAYEQYLNDSLELDRKGQQLVGSCKRLLDRIEKKWPQYRLDGYQNVWILKPGAKSRGRGIRCTSDLSVITEAISTRDCSLVIQKYIERPLLIYKTKFDIRQWFLVTDWNPLMLWFYNDCYLRFCSQEFSLDNFHESIHISNNTVQKNFKADLNRSNKLPLDNMWTCEEFIVHLRANGYGEVWTEKIVPGMKQAILCSLLCTQEQIEQRKTAFELFGADFMITQDMQPWLLEINSSPSMARTTEATKVLVNAVLEDTIKVVLDRKEDKECETGCFELIYQQPPANEPPHLDAQIVVQGARLARTTIRA